MHNYGQKNTSFEGVTAPSEQQRLGVQVITEKKKKGKPNYTPRCSFFICTRNTEREDDKQTQKGSGVEGDKKEAKRKNNCKKTNRKGNRKL